MEVVVFCGIQAAGKTAFYVERFLRTHVRISLDLVHTRARERALLETCLATRQPCVIDNTNVTRARRAVYIEAARHAAMRVIGYFFDVPLGEALARNRLRPGAERIPEPGIVAAWRRLEPPRHDEGFDVLYRVTLPAGGGFAVELSPPPAPSA
ncbi:MAG: AAA family ATPase [Planctomycetota bacterium]